MGGWQIPPLSGSLGQRGQRGQQGHLGQAAFTVFINMHVGVQTRPGFVVALNPAQDFCSVDLFTADMFIS